MPAAMIEEELEVAIKVVLVGNGGVGKSSMIQRFAKGTFTREYKKTIGVDFLEKNLEVRAQDTRLMLWDTAGQEEFDSITRAYYRGANVCVVAFSTVDRDSFLAVDSWKQKVEAEVGEVVMCVVQNKVDLIDKAAMTPEEVDSLARRLKLKVFRTSVKDNFNVDAVFTYLASKYIDRRARKMRQSAKKNSQIGFSGGMEDLSNKVDSSTTVPGGDDPPSMPSKEPTFKIQPPKQHSKKPKQSMCIIL